MEEIYNLLVKCCILAKLLNVLNLKTNASNTLFIFPRVIRSCNLLSDEMGSLTPLYKFVIAKDDPIERHIALYFVHNICVRATVCDSRYSYCHLLQWFRRNW